MMKKSTSGIRPALSGQKIDAMTPAQRRKLLEDIERSTPQRRSAESLPLSAAERARMVRVGRGLRTRGRPKLGKGTKVVSVSVEIELLKAADAYAASHGLKRAELFTQGLRKVLAA
jgi:hypothetical protein